MEVKYILWGIFYQKRNVKFMIQDKLHWLNSTRGFKRSALCKPGGPLSFRCFRIRRSQCEMGRWNVRSLRTGGLVAKKGRSLGRSRPITLAVWQIRMGVERIYADFRNARKTAQSAMTRKNKEIHLGFICMSIPIILCQFTFWKRWRDLFFKKRKDWNGLAWWWGLLIPFCVLECLPPGNPDQCRLPRGYQVTLLLNGERKLAGLCPMCNSHRISKTGTRGFIWGDRGSQGEESQDDLSGHSSR